MKRVLASFMLFAMVFSCLGAASAAEPETFRASLTLSRYFAELFAGNGSGRVTVSFDVKASKTADSVGVESIDFYTEDGDYVTSISGTTKNGLVDTDTGFHGGDFQCVLPSGNYYYAEVTVFAEVGSDYDSRTVTTSTVWVR